MAQCASEKWPQDRPVNGMIPLKFRETVSNEPLGI